MDSTVKKVGVVFVILFALSMYCKFDFIPFSSCRWPSTWTLRKSHITLSPVLTKTKHIILYEKIQKGCIGKKKITSNVTHSEHENVTNIRKEALGGHFVSCLPRDSE